ncbi:Na+/H+ antiporter subunit E [Plantactinospora sonchi]|uniref:Na+/H+ antiporter subunit E n=1 Tax=Plantactinospora sonchi TaxID=1544735 RepID=A0ABU7S5B3_9ACTN
MTGTAGDREPGAHRRPATDRDSADRGGTDRDMTGWGGTDRDVTDRDTGGDRRAGVRRPVWRRGRDHLITIAWLVVVWSLLWGEFSWGNLLGGVLVAVVVLVVFPLPRVTFGGRLRPLALADFVVWFVVELVVASVHVGWLAVRPRRQPPGAIVAVRLRVRTDLNLTLTAEVLSLVPGTLIVEADRETGTLYVHVLDAHDDRTLADSRDRILALEARLVRAIGSAAELRQVSVPGPSERRQPP